MNVRQPAADLALTIPERVARLRAAMERAGLAAYIVPSADPHLSEYLPERWRGRAWLSGFTGSMGTLVVTQDFVGLWVDGRYWGQAEAELAGNGIEVMKLYPGQSQPHVDWLAVHVRPGAEVGVDGSTLGLAAARSLRDALHGAGARLRTDVDLLELVWEGRPTLPLAPVYEHTPPYAMVSRADKLAQMRAAMREKGAHWHFVSTLDDIAWIFNLRGSDISFNPVFVAHALIGLDGATLFVADDKIDAPLRERLAADGVRVGRYMDAPAALAAIEPGSTLLIDPRRVTFGLMQAVQEGVKVVEAVNPSTFAKSCKTDAEIDQVRATMEQDGAALAEFFTWLEGALGHERITELTIDERLTAERARRPGFVSLSFATIAGFNANGAMPHYHATQASHAVIEGSGLLLIDSGAQYLSGTTDITRVVPVGTVSDAHKRDFTIVLKGMIALSRARFPRGIRSPMLDAIARAPIWAAGIDYGHGTGHGVGYFLNVHEGPQVISHYAAVEPYTAMEVGMITSNEPGSYRPGQWGIRIENLLVNRPAESTEFGEFLCFETLTLCPIDTRCIDRSLLRDDEIVWLNAYHETVRERVGKHLSGDAKAWLGKRTEAI
jgi:Xaa-Pro aminopeptidase